MYVNSFRLAGSCAGSRSDQGRGGQVSEKLRDVGIFFFFFKFCLQTETDDFSEIFNMEIGQIGCQ